MKFMYNTHTHTSRIAPHIPTIFLTIFHFCACFHPMIKTVLVINTVTNRYERFTLEQSPDLMTILKLDSPRKRNHLTYDFFT